MGELSKGGEGGQNAQGVNQPGQGGKKDTNHAHSTAAVSTRDVKCSMKMKLTKRYRLKRCDNAQRQIDAIERRAFLSLIQYKAPARAVRASPELALWRRETRLGG